MLDTIGRAIELLNEGDIDTFYELIADDCVLTGPMGELRGREAILEGDRGVLLQMDPHYRRLVAGPIASGNDIAMWGEFGGTVKATGKSFKNEMCSILHMRDGKIVAWEYYFDLSKSTDAWMPDPTLAAD